MNVSSSVVQRVALNKFFSLLFLFFFILVGFIFILNYLNQTDSLKVPKLISNFFTFITSSSRVPNKKPAALCSERRLFLEKHLRSNRLINLFNASEFEPIFAFLSQGFTTGSDLDEFRTYLTFLIQNGSFGGITYHKGLKPESILNLERTFSETIPGCLVTRLNRKPLKQENRIALLSPFINSEDVRVLAQYVLFKFVDNLLNEIKDSDDFSETSVETHCSLIKDDLLKSLNSSYSNFKNPLLFDNLVLKNY